MSKKKKKYKLTFSKVLVIIMLVLCIITWSLKQLTINTISSSEISYVEE